MKKMYILWTVAVIAIASLSISISNFLNDRMQTEVMDGLVAADRFQVENMGMLVEVVSKLQDK